MDLIMTRWTLTWLNNTMPLNRLKYAMKLDLKSNEARSTKWLLNQAVGCNTLNEYPLIKAWRSRTSETLMNCWTSQWNSMNDQMDLNLVRPIFNATCDNTLEPMILCPFKCKWNVLWYNGYVDEMNAYQDMQS